MHPISSENKARRFSNTMHSKLFLHSTQFCKYRHAHSMQRICFISIKNNSCAFYIIDLQAFLNYRCDYHCGIGEGLYNHYDLHIVFCEVSGSYTHVTCAIWKILIVLYSSSAYTLWAWPRWGTALSYLLFSSQKYPGWGRDRPWLFCIRTWLGNCHRPMFISKGITVTTYHFYTGD